MAKQLYLLFCLLLVSGMSYAQDKVIKSPELGKLDLKKYKHLFEDTRLYAPKDKFQPIDLNKKLETGQKMKWMSSNKTEPINADSILLHPNLKQKFSQNDIAYQSTMPIIGMSKMKMPIYNLQDSTTHHHILQKKIHVITVPKE